MHSSLALHNYNTCVKYHRGFIAIYVKSRIREGVVKRSHATSYTIHHGFSFACRARHAS